MKDKIEKSLTQVSKWVETRNYRAYDPGDGQLSFLRFVTFKSLFLERMLTASVLRVPFNIRPLLGIAPHTSTKGMGYMAWGYVRRYKLTNDEQFAQKAVACLDWLIKNRAPGFSQYCWGNHFTFTTRAGRIPHHAPTIVWSSLIGQAFVEAYEGLGNQKYLEVASSICDWILTLPKEETKTGVCLSYVAFKQSSIHNSNMLGAALLARVGKLTQNGRALEMAKLAMQYSCTRQNSDGAWFYGEAAKYQWIDNFHTGYNLDSLKRYIDSTGDLDFVESLQSGFKYFLANFTEPDGKPKYYHNQSYPIDIQCAAQAIDTLAFFADNNPQALALACKVADWTIDNMQAPDGYFYYRDLGWKKIKTPMFHWGQATMFKALAHLQNKLSNEKHSGRAITVSLSVAH